MKRNRPHLLATLALLALAGVAAHAQVYRIVGPDGRVTFSDKPPVETSAKAAPVAAGAGAASEGGGSLPFALRQIANRFPVTLYTSPTCGPCGSGRAMLASRGIPFTERTITTNEDGEALQRISGDLTVPLLTIGSQQIKGFSDTEWTQFLDAAGYPKTSQLPASYRNPPAAPLVAVQRPAPAAAPAAATQQAAPGNTQRPPLTTATPQTATPPSNPAGIQF